LAPQLSALYREAQRESQCHRRRLGISEIRPFDVADYVERLQGEAAAPSVKQELAAIRMLFDWAGGRPGAAVESGLSGALANARGEDRQDSALDGSEWRRLLDAIAY
jgi:hypothetical protein